MESAPTGCYKCGRPGHWSRDCPFSAPNPDGDSNSSSSSFKPKSGGGGGGSSFRGGGSGSDSLKLAPKKPAEKPKKVPRSRPKLTPQILLSDDGLGFVLRYFPRAFKYRGHGNEVRDLGNLLELYCEWHSRLIPYYSFNQFVHKVEQVAATKQVKTTLNELRERVANGGDPTKLRKPPVMEDIPVDDQEAEEGSRQWGDMFSEPQNANDIQEDMLNEIYDKVTEVEPSRSAQNMIDAGIIPPSVEASNGVANSAASLSGKAEITEEQRARMEANRLKALEKRAARARASQAT